MSKIIDIIKSVYLDKSIDFEAWLEEQIYKYMEKNQGKYISLGEFMLRKGAVDFPDPSIYEYRCVKFIKKWEIEYFKSIAVQNEKIAYEIYKDLTKETETVDTEVKVSFETAIDTDEVIIEEVEE